MAVWAFHLALPLLGLWLLIARPTLDVRWQHHPSHFWLVMSVAALSVGLGLRMQSQARERADPRLLLVGFAFTTSAGFLFLHALATPGVLVGDANLGFELATPVGLAVASALLAASSFEQRGRRGPALVRHERRLRTGLLGVMTVWGVLSVAGISPLDAPPAEVETSSGLQILALVSVALYATAAVNYFTVHRSRPSVMLIGLITASALLAEAMVTVVYARNWQLSWWLWHVLMAAGFGFFTYAAYVHYRREGSAAGLFNAITSEHTVSRIRAEYSSALDALTSALHKTDHADLTPAEIDLITAGLAARFDLTEGQVEILGRAATALAREQEHARRLAALADIGAGSRVRQEESELIPHILGTVASGFGRDRVRIGLIRDGSIEFLPGQPSPDWDGDAGEVLSVPLMIEGSSAGVIEIFRPGGGFSDGDRSIIETLASETSIALENVRLYSQLEGLFRSYMSPDVATALLADPDQARLGGAVVETTTLFADLRGFTTFSERSGPEQIVEVLNRYFGLAVPRILGVGGTVVQFVGDALLAVFNAPARQHDHALRACRAALSIQRAIGEVVAQHPDWPLFRIGVNTGTTLVGNIGSDQFRSFNVMGDAVNVAARLEGIAAPGSVVIGASTYDAIRDVASVESLGELELKGKERPVAAYRLLDLVGT